MIAINGPADTGHPFRPHHGSVSGGRPQHRTIGFRSEEGCVHGLRAPWKVNHFTPGPRNIAHGEPRILLDLPVKKVLALEQQIAQILVLVRSARNRTAMVNCLPPEVLAKILSFRHDDRDLISATHVCERWRSTLLSIPLLWTEVVFGDPDRTMTYLERSKGAPLRVSIGGSTLDPSTGDMPWIGRTSSLRISGDQDYIESIVGRLCLSAPLLQDLIFNAPPGPQDGRTMGHLIHIPSGFLGEQVPSLRSLAFFSVSPVPVTSIPLQHLTNLEWTDSFVVIGELFTLLA